MLTQYSPENKIKKLIWKKNVYEGRKEELQRQIFLLNLCHSDLDAELSKKYHRLMSELQDCELCLQAVRNLFGEI